jgi:hypothetical protein
VNDRPLKGAGILQAMLTMDAVALASLLAAAWIVAHPDPGARDPGAMHVAWGLAAALLNLVARCVAIFYMLASGRAVKDLVAGHGLDPALAARAMRIKRGVETLATLALVPVMVAAVGGGSVRPDGTGAGSHAGWSWAAVAAAALCLAVDVRAGLRNYALLREVDGLVRNG